MSVVLLERPAEGVALLRINRPEARNALNLEVRTLLAQRFDELTSDADIRCVVITGDAKSFAAGADIREMMGAGTVELLRRGLGRLWDAVGGFPKPLIAAVSGFALGAGCELAMHADIIVAGQSTKFGQPEVKLGILPGGGGTQRLPRAVGKFRAMKMLLTGEPILAAEALSMGLVSEVVADDAVEARACELAAQIAALAPLALMQIKEVVLAGQDVPLASALLLERKALQVLFASVDKEEGMRAFSEKRKPKFEGR